jgi:hypothetical protein
MQTKRWKIYRDMGETKKIQEDSFVPAHNHLSSRIK